MFSFSFLTNNTGDYNQTTKKKKEKKEKQHRHVGFGHQHAPNSTL